MNKLRQSLRRKRPVYVPEASRPHQWQADEEAVRKGKCNFAVREEPLLPVSSTVGTLTPRVLHSRNPYSPCPPQEEPLLPVSSTVGTLTPRVLHRRNPYSPCPPQEEPLLPVSSTVGTLTPRVLHRRNPYSPCPPQ
ncbi:hypothetical protein NHX12_008002 [Muraenolepis orangiensis]|uniref:Uncharacterized protein n=1 Tax=Muraenolepis orangiensis TaxID=630683 RepID=A0A9Q0DN20_9TELE|nr:hypothetical protein NHX12_008002 [Muraenolepis orangiensis]